VLAAPYPDDVGPLFASLEQIAATAPPAELPSCQPPFSQWAAVGADPESLLSLGIFSREWLEESLPSLMAAESSAESKGDALVHNDLYSGNVCFTPRGVVLIDWGAAIRGSASIDVAFALLSLRAEGATVPALDFPDEPAYAAWIAGLFAVGVSAPPPDWAEPGSTLREDMAADLVHALRWASERLELSPLSSP
jgi:Phosphotransferase enzyme family